MSNYYKTLVAEIRINIAEMFAYRFSFIMDIVVMFGILSFAFISKSGYRFVSYYNISDNSEIVQKTMILYGFIMWMLSNAALTVICNGIREEFLKGTFLQKMMAIVPVWWLFLGKTISSVIITLLEIIVIVLLAKIIYSVTLFTTLSIILTIIVSFLGMFGLSLCLGALVLEKKKIGQLLLVIQAILLLLSDVFTVIDLPIYSKVIPLSLGNHLIRNIIINSLYNRDLVFLVMVSLLWLVLGCVFFQLSYRRIKKVGYFCY